MKRIINLQVMFLTVLIYVAPPALAIPPAPPGPYLSIEDQFGPTMRPEIGPVTVQRTRPVAPDLTQYNRAPVDRGMVPHDRGYFPEPEEPRIQWPKPYPQESYQGGYGGYPKGMPR